MVSDPSVLLLLLNFMVYQHTGYIGLLEGSATSKISYTLSEITEITLEITEIPWPQAKDEIRNR